MDPHAASRRPGVTFHDGTPLDAQALKTTFDDYLKVPGSKLAAQLAEVTSLDVVDDLTVVYKLAETNAAFADNLVGPAGWPFSPTAAAAAGEDARDYETGCTRVGADRDPYIVFSQALTDGPLNMTAFPDPEIDAQLDVLRTTTDLDERKAAVEAIGLVLNENVPNTVGSGTLTVMAARDAVKNLDGWVFPDGTLGNGAASAQVMWGYAWLTD